MHVNHDTGMVEADADTIENIVTNCEIPVLLVSYTEP
jgi:hypothetical protein